jgi:signal transduction histidine kinase
MFVVAAALLAMIAVLGTLQYRWLGRISDAERERMTANLRAHAAAFAHEFDREVTLAYLTFQLDPLADTENSAARLSARHERWLATARYPRLIKDIYITSQSENADQPLQRFNPATRFIEPVEWPEWLRPIRASFEKTETTTPRESFVIRAVPSSIWDEIPALVVASPMMLMNERTIEPSGASPKFRMFHVVGFTILVLDRAYIANEMLPLLAQQQFRSTGSASDYQLAVVNRADQNLIYRSTPAFAPKADAAADASADLFQLRPQDFPALTTEVRKFTATVAAHAGRGGERRNDVFTRVVPRDGTPVSIMVQQNMSSTGRSSNVSGGLASRTVGPRWQLIVKHPSGSLEAAVNLARRRNLIVSSSVLALLVVSVGFLVITTRRAQELARQQMEFVAAVSHELRTPLAVIRSAADNLAEGVVHDQAQVRKYGELVRGEGRRLTEMVEQILELAGIESGQRSFALRPVAIAPLLEQVVTSSSTLVEEAGIEVEFDLPDRLPAALGDEQALRRVFQNLVSNAIKYGAQGRWIGLKARTSGKEIIVTVADRGVGIPSAEVTHIFEPFYRAPSVVAAQIQGAGLGLNLVQRIVEAHGGRIDVRSAEGSGSEFIVHLPAASEEPVTRAASAPGTATLPSQS